MAFESGIKLRPVSPGWQGVVAHGDGTATKVWAPTRNRARKKAEAVLDGGDA